MLPILSIYEQKAAQADFITGKDYDCFPGHKPHTVQKRSCAAVQVRHLDILKKKKKTGMKCTD